jgi:hypothetical protein
MTGGINDLGFLQAVQQPGFRGFLLNTALLWIAAQMRKRQRLGLAIVKWLVDGKGISKRGDSTARG